MKGSTKIIIIVLAIGALSAGAYFAVGTANGQTEPLLQSQVTNTAVTVPQGNSTTDQTIQNVLRQINDLDQIKLNTDIFDKPEFLALKDISQDLPEPTDVGRPNPFAPIGVDVGTVATDVAIDGMPATIDTTTNSTSTTSNGLMGLGTVSTTTTNEVQNIGQRSATVSGVTTVTASTNRWFEWGTNQNTVSKTTKQTGTAASFTATLTGLNPNTTYYVKAAVEQNGAVVYGDIVVFKTAQ